MKIFCLLPRENWFCDRYGQEYLQYSSHKISFNDLNADVIWLLAAWCWNQLPIDYLKSRPTVCTIHHEVPWKFDKERESSFKSRDEYVDVYHVPCEKTAKFISKFTDRPIEIISYWANNLLWKQRDKIEMKKKFNLPQDKLIISSFQRDTESSDLISPKLEKGPDIFCDFVEHVSRSKEVHVLLNGWRRQYIVSRLEKSNIPYTYFELPDINEVSEMYSATDLYVVGSRVEGGPQSIIECALSKTPIISTDVGIARNILPYTCIRDVDNFTKYDNFPTEEDVQYSYNAVKKYHILNQVRQYDDFFEKVLV